MIGGSNGLRFDLFPDPVGHFGLSRQWGVAGVAGGDLSHQGYSTSQLVCTNLCLFIQDTDKFQIFFINSSLNEFQPHKNTH